VGINIGDYHIFWRFPRIKIAESSTTNYSLRLQETHGSKHFVFEGLLSLECAMKVKISWAVDGRFVLPTPNLEPPIRITAWLSIWLVVQTGEVRQGDEGGFWAWRNGSVKETG
jgi:hypothetical protein